MKLFIDTANVNEIRKAAEMGILSGVTTGDYTHLTLPTNREV